jgi:hypothetical protein
LKFQRCAGFGCLNRFPDVGLGEPGTLPCRLVFAEEDLYGATRREEVLDTPELRRETLELGECRPPLLPESCELVDRLDAALKVVGARMDLLYPVSRI